MRVLQLCLHRIGLLESDNHHGKALKPIGFDAQYPT